MLKQKKSKTTKPMVKGLYAWTSFHAGSFLLFVETKNKYHRFFFLPGPTEYFLIPEDFTKYVNTGVLEFVDVLPDEIFQETVNFFLNCPTNTPIIINDEQKTIN